MYLIYTSTKKIYNKPNNMEKQKTAGWKAYVPEWGHFDIRGIFSTKSEAWATFRHQYAYLGYFPKNKPKECSLVVGDIAVPQAIGFENLRIGDIAFSEESYGSNSLEKEGAITKLYTGEQIVSQQNPDEKRFYKNLVGNGLSVEDIKEHNWVEVWEAGNVELYNYNGDPSGVVCLSPIRPQIIFTRNPYNANNNWGRFSMYGRHYHIETANGKVTEVTEEEQTEFIEDEKVHPMWLIGDQPSYSIPKTLQVLEEDKFVDVIPISQPFVAKELSPYILILVQTSNGSRSYVEYDPVTNSFYLGPKYLG